MKCLVLLNASVGPWSMIDKIKRPVLQVRGLAGGTIRVEMQGSTTESQTFTSDGDFELEPGSWARLHASKPSASLMCFITSAKVA